MSKNIIDDLSGVVTQEIERKKSNLLKEIESLKKEVDALIVEREKEKSKIKESLEKERAAILKDVIEKQKALDALIKEASQVEKEKGILAEQIKTLNEDKAYFLKQKEDFKKFQEGFLEKERQAELLIEQYQSKLKEMGS